MKMSKNLVILIGNLGGDPEVRYTGNGTPVCNMRLATNEFWKKDDKRQEHVEWHRLVAWGKLADEDHKMDLNFMQYHFNQALKNLNGEEREVIEKRWLGEEKITLREIGEDWGLTKQRVGQIEINALNKIRRHLGKEATVIEQAVLGSHGVVQEYINPHPIGDENE